jgi:hypothetical protein
MSVDATFFGLDLKEDRVDLEVQHALSRFSDFLFYGFDILAELRVEIRGS